MPTSKRKTVVDEGEVAEYGPTFNVKLYREDHEALEKLHVETGAPRALLVRRYVHEGVARGKYPTGKKR